jgi:hypothetical protein
MAEFDDPNELVRAARETYRAGYRKIDAHSPYPIEELSEAIGFHRNRLPLIVLIGGICGGVGGFMLQYLASTQWYPLNIGGRPLNSWPAFIPPTFETTVLLAAFSAVLGMLALNGLPQPYHPVFNVPRFALATKDRFFLVIEAADPKYDSAKTREFLQSLNAREVCDIDE